MLFLPNLTLGGGALYELVGNSWVQASSGGLLYYALPPNSEFVHASMAYDRRRDKVVLFGRIEYLGGGGGPHSFSADTWEWDPVNQWQHYPASGPITDQGGMWFDDHRGRLLRQTVHASPSPWAEIHELDDSHVWQPVSIWLPVVGGYVPWINGSIYDPKRNRIYSPHYGQAVPGHIAYVHDVHPAAYESTGEGCTGANAPALRLHETWTRAWLGGRLELDVDNAQTPYALLVSGWSDQFAGTTPLPVDLSAAGMPGCTLHVSPDSLVFGKGAATGTTIPFAFQIPNDPSLVDVEFFQQAFVWAPGSNAAGLQVSNAIRATVGKSK